MTTIYLIRHGETEANIALKYQGCTDTPLTPNGLKQVACLAEHLRPVRFDCIYTSPMTRAVRTAQAVGEGRNIPIIIDPALIEVCGGLFEGRSIRDLAQEYPEEVRIWNEEYWKFVGPGLEDGVSAKFRQVQQVIDRMVRRHPGQTVALSTHGCVQRCFNAIMQGWPEEGQQQLPFGANCSYSAARFDQNGPSEVLCLNRNCHLAGFEVHHFGTD